MVSVIVLSLVVSYVTTSIIMMFASLDRKTVKIKRLNGRVEPFYVATEGSVCADCYASFGVTLSAGERTLIPLGFALELPKQTEAVIRPRSGMSKKGIDISIGTIDSDYRGEVCANVVNNTGKEVVIEEGTRICQIAFREVPLIRFKFVKELKATTRGDGGFGHSGEK